MAKSNFKTEDWIKWGAIGIGGLVAFKAVSGFVGPAVASITGAYTGITDNVTSTVVANQTGTDKATAEKCINVAETVYKALDSFWQDEPKAIAALNTLNSAFEVQLTCKNYFQKYRASLKDACEDSIHRFGFPTDLIEKNWS